MKIYLDETEGYAELTPDVISAKSSMTILDGKAEHFVVVCFDDGSQRTISFPEDKSGKNCNDLVRRIALAIDVGRKILFIA